jgi:ABC-type microcin C transport system permease subunit YejB
MSDILKCLRDYLRFDFGDSLFRSASVLQLIKELFLYPLLWGYGERSLFIWCRFHSASEKPFTMAVV